MTKEEKQKIIAYIEETEINRSADDILYAITRLNDGKKNAYDVQIKPHLDEITEYYARGMTKAEIAKQLNTTYHTLHKYEKLEKDLAEAFEKAKKARLEFVEGILFKCAVGYKDFIEDVKVLSDGEIIRYIKENKNSPNIQAMKFYLANEYPDKWANRLNVEVSNVDKFFDDDDDDEVGD